MPATTETTTAPAAAAPAAPQAPVKTENTPADFMASEMQDFADMDKATPATPPEKPEKTDKPAKPAAKVEAPEAPEKPTETAPEKPAETEPVRPVKAADLRAAYEGLKKRVKDEFEPQLQSLKAKVQEYESKGQGDTKAITEELQTVKQRNAELEKHIAYVDYSQSEQFKKEHAIPYREAWDEAVAEFRELTIRQPAGEDEFGETKFATRPATEQDILTLANMSLSEMDEAANKLFGASASRAINHIQNLKRLTAKQDKALKDARENAAKFQQQRQVETQTRMAERAKRWEEINKSLEEKFPKAFKPIEGDADDKASHTKGFALANLMFSGPAGLTPEQVESLPPNLRDTIKANQPLSEAQTVQLHALSRLKIANHDRKVAALKKATARIAELEKALAEYEKSEPDASGAGEGSKVTSKDWMDQAADELRAMDK